MSLHRQYGHCWDSIAHELRSTVPSEVYRTGNACRMHYTILSKSGRTGVPSEATPTDKTTPESSALTSEGEDEPEELIEGATTI